MHDIIQILSETDAYIRIINKQMYQTVVKFVMLISQQPNRGKTKTGITQYHTGSNYYMH